MHCRPLVVIMACLLLLGGCATSPPRQADDICRIFAEKRGWYRHALKASKSWDIPVSVMMSMTYQESSFRAKARPPRTRILWIIPWRRPSSAYGYVQATNEAWKDYVRATGRGGADRDDFGDAMDFIGWYNRRSADQLGLGSRDAYNLYLAYHDGVNGYRRGTWKKKSWLPPVAQKVSRRAQTYQRQLDGCADDLRTGPWWWPW